MRHWGLEYSSLLWMKVVLRLPSAGGRMNHLIILPSSKTLCSVLMPFRQKTINNLFFVNSCDSHYDYLKSLLISAFQGIMRRPLKLTPRSWRSSLTASLAIKATSSHRPLIRKLKRYVTDEIICLEDISLKCLCRYPHSRPSPLL